MKLPLILLTCAYNIWYFVIDGDPQIGLERDLHGNPIVREWKSRAAETISELNKTYPVDLVLVAGDLTDNGKDGKPCIFPNRREDQLSVYIKDYAHPIEDAGFPVYACPGNHDHYTGRPFAYKGVSNYLANKYGATNVFRAKNKSGLYAFTHKGILFISMGIYPYHLKWLKKLLKKFDPKQPIIFFWHYNTVDSEPFADWWSDKEKDKFHAVIANRNVQLIVNGHWHSSGMGHWHGIPVVRGSGDKIGLICMHGSKLENITFHRSV